MISKSTLPRLLVVFVLSIVLIVSSSTFVSAQLGGIEGGLLQSELTGGAFINAVMDVSGGPGFIMVSPFDFKPYHSTIDGAEYLGGALYNPLAVQSRVVAGLNLPNGATLEKVTLYFYDTYASSDISLQLYRYGVDGTILPFLEVNPVGLNTGINHLSSSTFEPGADLIDNQNYSYFLLVTIGGGGSTNQLLINVRVDYAYTTSLPVVMH